MVAELEHWHDFYLLVGTAGATLVALLFVAISLGTGFLTDKASGRDARLLQPRGGAFHRRLSSSAAIGLVPAHKPAIFAALVGGVRGDRRRGFALHHRRAAAPPLDATTCRTTSPTGSCRRSVYVALLVAAAMILAEHDFALVVLAGALLLLLIVNIRNAWDLTLSMVRQHTKRK